MGRLRLASLTQAIQDGATAVDAELMFALDVGEQFITDMAFQVGELSTNHAFEVKMVGAGSVAYILVYKG